MLDLKKRITQSDTRFQIAESEAKGRMTFYNFFNLSDDTIEKNKENPLKYFSAMGNDTEKDVPEGTFVCICEYQGEKLVDEAHIFCTKKAKPQLSWSIEAAPKYQYENDPHKVKITWTDSEESFAGKRCTLFCKKFQREYPFLTERICPKKGCAEFIISLPPDVSVTNLEVRFDDDVKLKYDIKRG